MLLAEDLLLLLTDDDTGRLVLATAQADVGLGGAMLVELALRQRVEVAGPHDDAKEGRLVVRDAGPTGDTLLDDALATVGEKQGGKPRSAVARLGKHLRAPLYERLAGAGIVRLEEGKVLGLLPTHRWPTQDARHEAATRADVAAALQTGVAKDPRVAALVSLLLALDVVHKVVDLDELGLTKRQARSNAAAMAEGDWAGKAVRQAVDSANAAVVAAISSAVVLGGSGT